MSLCNVILQPTVGFLMADAGLWDWEGRLIGLHQKLFLFPKARAAVTTRGGGGVESTWWQEQADRLASLPDLLAWLPEFGKDMKASNTRYAPDDPGHRHDVEVTVVFWDPPANRPAAMQLETADVGKAGDGYAAILDRDFRRRPGQLYVLPGLALAPTLTWDNSLPALSRVLDERRFDVRRIAARLVDKQRATKHPIDGHLATTVAGWVDVAVVTADGVTLERVRDWPADAKALKPRA